MESRYRHIELSHLRTTAGEDTAFLLELLTMIHDDIEVKLKGIAVKLDVADLAGVRRESHTLKGHGLHLGASELVERSSSLEIAASEGNGPLCRIGFPSLEAECMAVRREIQECIAEEGG